MAACVLGVPAAGFEYRGVRVDRATVKVSRSVRALNAPGSLVLATVSVAVRRDTVRYRFAAGEHHKSGKLTLAP